MSYPCYLCVDFRYSDPGKTKSPAEVAGLSSRCGKKAVASRPGQIWAPLAD
jgi:hypothetical protein